MIKQKRYMVINPKDATFVGFFGEHRINNHGYEGTIVEITNDEFDAIDENQYDRYNLNTKKFYKEEVSIKQRREEVLQIRKGRYSKEADPLYMEWQFDQTEEAFNLWRAKVAEIKASHPIPTE